MEHIEYEWLVRQLEPTIEHGYPVIIGFWLNMHQPREQLLKVRNELTKYGRDACPSYLLTTPHVLELEVTDPMKARELVKRLDPNVPPERRLEAIVFEPTHEGFEMGITIDPGEQMEEGIARY